MSRATYHLRLDLEIPARDLARATEKALALLRPTVREKARARLEFVGHYRGSWFRLTATGKAPAITKPRGKRAEASARRRRGIR